MSAQYVRSGNNYGRMWHRVRPISLRGGGRSTCCGMTLVAHDVFGTSADIEGMPYCSRCALFEYKRPATFAPEKENQ